MYDRRALDCTSEKPLVNSLHQLTYLTASSPRVRDTLCQDGGLERLVAIMKACRLPPPLFYKTEEENEVDITLVQYKWQLCLQCLVNLGSRGNETNRRRIVEAGAVPILATILDNYLDMQGQESIASLGPAPSTSPAAQIALMASTASRAHSSTHVADVQVNSMSETTAAESQARDNDGNTTGESNDTHSMITDATESNTSSATANPAPAQAVTVTELDHNAVALRVERFLSQLSRATGQTVVGPNGPLTVSGGAGAAVANTDLETSGAGQEASFLRSANGILLPRDRDVCSTLEILAFVSKYWMLKRDLQQTHLVPVLSLRSPVNLDQGTESDDTMDVDSLSSSSRCDLTAEYEGYDFENVSDIDDEYLTPQFNLFELVERFTVLWSPRDFPHWAGIIMRNSCRKDESRGGIRQCANFQCQRWESQPREFPKCRRCKRPKYCSKHCQLQAWSLHRYWCTPPNSSATTSSSTAGSVAASLQSQTSTISVASQASASTVTDMVPVQPLDGTAAPSATSRTSPVVGIAEVDMGIDDVVSGSVGERDRSAEAHLAHNEHS